MALNMLTVAGRNTAETSGIALVSFVEVIEWEKLFTEGVGCMIEKTLQISVFLKEGQEQKPCISMSCSLFCI